MAFHGLTFPNQNVSALDDGGFYRSFRGDGVIQGCDISFTTDSITIQAGWLMAGGRLIQVDGATSITFEDMITTGYGRLMLQIDTSQASTVEDFGQISTPIDYSASIDGFTAPVQEDINLGGGTIYQFVLAVVNISNGNITGITSSLLLSPLSPNRTLFPCDLVIDRGADLGGYTYFLQNGITKGRVGYGNDGFFRCGTVDGSYTSLGGILVPTSQNEIMKVFGNYQDIYFMPQGITNYGIAYSIGKTSGFLNSHNQASYYSGFRRLDANSQPLSYIRQTYSGYMDIWAKQNVQIRCGAGNEDNDNVRFLFGTTGVLTAKGMYTTTRSGSTLVIDSSGAIGRTSSLRKYKKNILDVTEEQANKGYELRPITYESAIDGDIKERQFGFIAEEVEEVVPELCTYDLEGNIDGVAYARVCSLLLKQNQMLKARVDALEKRVAKLEKEQVK